MITFYTYGKISNVNVSSRLSHLQIFLFLTFYRQVYIRVSLFTYNVRAIIITANMRKQRNNNKVRYNI